VSDEPASIDREPPEPEGFFEGLDFRAVAVGVVVDHAATILFAILLVAVLLPADVEVEDEAAIAAAMEAVAGSTQYLISALVGGLICTVLAGFVGARRAGRRFAQHGFAIALASAALVLVLGPAGAGESPIWYEAFGWILQLPAGILGGLMAQWSAEQPETQAE